MKTITGGRLVNTAPSISGPNRSAPPPSAQRPDPDLDGLQIRIGNDQVGPQVHIPGVNRLDHRQRPDGIPAHRDQHPEQELQRVRPVKLGGFGEFGRDAGEMLAKKESARRAGGERHDQRPVRYFAT